MVVYISGKISGLDFEEVNAKLTEAEDFLTEIGIQAVNPLKNGLSAGDALVKRLRRAIEMLNDCDGIYMMEGWQESAGACIEYNFAVRTGKIILFASNIMRNQGIVLEIENAIHEVTGLHLNQYNTRSRKRDGFYARTLFVHHCRREKMKQEDIAKYIHRDRSSVLRFLNKYNEEVRYNEFFRVMAERVNNILTSK